MNTLEKKYIKYRNYTDEDIIKFSKEVSSITQLIKKLGLKPSGGNYATMKRKLGKLNVDISNWKFNGWSKGKQLKDWANYIHNSNLKKNLIKIRGNKCEKCHNEFWMGKPIALELHHIDGDRTNNVLDNLQLLCPNCHSLTDNWRGKGNKGYVVLNKKEKITLPKKKKVTFINRCIVCGKVISSKSNYCKRCVPHKRKVKRPTKEYLEDLIKTNSFVSLGKRFGVSDTAIRKWCKSYGIKLEKYYYQNTFY